LSDTRIKADSLGLTELIFRLFIDPAQVKRQEAENLQDANCQPDEHPSTNSQNYSSQLQKKRNPMPLIR